MNEHNDDRFRFLSVIAEDLSRAEISFPTFSDVTIRVRAALDDPLLSVDRLASVVSREPLLAGLLQDIGPFYLLSRVGTYPQLAANTVELDLLLDEWHAPIGSSILNAMDLPAATVLAVEQHHAGAMPTPLMPPLTTLTDVLVIANHAARQFGSQPAMEAGRTEPPRRPSIRASADCSSVRSMN